MRGAGLLGSWAYCAAAICAAAALSHAMAAMVDGLLVFLGYLL